jgi:uncharacterized protein YjbI with pentapeptide repeats
MFVLVGILVLSAILALWKLPQLQARAALRRNPECDLFKLENDARTTLAQALAGLFLLAGLAVTWMQIDQSRHEATASQAAVQEAQLRDRYATALEQFQRPELEVVIGAIYSLEQIAIESPKDALPIMEFLATFVRDHPQAEDSGPSNHASHEKAIERLYEPPELAPDVQAAMTVIGRGLWSEWWPDHSAPTSPLSPCLDLSGAQLSGLRLVDATLPPVCLEEAHLDGARIVRSNLTGARLNDALLSGSVLVNTNLTDASLADAHLTGAWLIGVILDKADLHRADLSAAYISDASFDGANMEAALLNDARLFGGSCMIIELRDKNPYQTDLLQEWDLLRNDRDGADLSGANNLAQEQIDVTFADRTTRLPVDFHLNAARSNCRSARSS